LTHVFGPWHSVEKNNLIQSKGIQVSNTDFLICAVSTRYNMPIFTTDKDFTFFKKYIPITLHAPRLTKE